MKRNRGFTLAELLIVVAIIAVLVAIAIPVFTSQLEKSREATDLANARAAYAEVMAAAVTGDENLKTSDGKYQASVSLKQKQAGWVTPTDNLEIGGVPYLQWNEKDPAVGRSCVVTVDPITGVVSIDWSGEGRVTNGSTGGGGNTSGGGSNIQPRIYIPPYTGQEAKATQLHVDDAYGGPVNIEDVLIDSNGTPRVYSSRLPDSHSYMDYSVNSHYVYETESNGVFRTDGYHWFKWDSEKNKWVFYV